MSVREARDHLLWLQVLDLIKDKLSEEEIATIVHWKEAATLTQNAVTMLLATADQSKARNFVALQFAGLPLPFDRAFVELVRPGGLHSSDLVREQKTMLRNACSLIRTMADGSAGGREREAAAAYADAIEKEIGDD